LESDPRRLKLAKVTEMAFANAYHKSAEIRLHVILGG
jgi:hypothetical protein